MSGSGMASCSTSTSRSSAGSQTTFPGGRVRHRRAAQAHEPSEALVDVDLVRVVTTKIAGSLWPAWHEVELIGSP